MSGRVRYVTAKQMKNWIDQIDKTTGEFQALFGTLKSEELNWKPAPGAWSIAQNIDHLIVINQTYFPALHDLRAGSYTLPFLAKSGFIVSLLGKMILNGVNPDRKKKIKTFPLWEPMQDPIPGDILEKFSEHQHRLKSEIEASGDLVQRKAVISSPANRNIVYRLETAFDIIVTHERRHLEQSKEVLALLEKSAVHGTGG